MPKSQNTINTTHMLDIDYLWFKSQANYTNICLFKKHLPYLDHLFTYFFPLFASIPHSWMVINLYRSHHSNFWETVLFFSNSQFFWILKTSKLSLSCQRQSRDSRVGNWNWTFWSLTNNFLIQIVFTNIQIFIWMINTMLAVLNFTR